ncbi:hypothetical protein ACFOZ7_17545 [Natribaculum luteum]|uniref:HEAT repeat domain-containing protein n=1 Tax=Natribaculum luteum TaxID=1586232 RepID=A0ABD5P363_9EURY|nr:hypothetical protein [Natribaculum luteum]
MQDPDSRLSHRSDAEIVAALNAVTDDPVQGIDRLRFVLDALTDASKVGQKYRIAAGITGTGPNDVRDAAIEALEAIAERSPTELATEDRIARIANLAQSVDTTGSIRLIDLLGDLAPHVDAGPVDDHYEPLIRRSLDGPPTSVTGHALELLGERLCANPQSDALVRLLSRALNHESPAVRAVAIGAAGTALAADRPRTELAVAFRNGDLSLGSGSAVDLGIEPDEAIFEVNVDGAAARMLLGEAPAPIDESDLCADGGPYDPSAAALEPQSGEAALEPRSESSTESEDCSPTSVGAGSIGAEPLDVDDGVPRLLQASAVAACRALDGPEEVAEAATEQLSALVTADAPDRRKAAAHAIGHTLASAETDRSRDTALFALGHLITDTREQVRRSTLRAVERYLDGAADATDLQRSVIESGTTDPRAHLDELLAVAVSEYVLSDRRTHALALDIWDEYGDELDSGSLRPNFRLVDDGDDSNHVASQSGRNASSDSSDRSESERSPSVDGGGCRRPDLDDGSERPPADSRSPDERKQWFDDRVTELTTAADPVAAIEEYFHQADTPQHRIAATRAIAERYQSASDEIDRDDRRRLDALIDEAIEDDAATVRKAAIQATWDAFESAVAYPWRDVADRLRSAIDDPDLRVQIAAFGALDDALCDEAISPGQLNEVHDLDRLLDGTPNETLAARAGRPIRLNLELKLLGRAVATDEAAWAGAGPLLTSALSSQNPAACHGALVGIGYCLDAGVVQWEGVASRIERAVAKRPPKIAEQAVTTATTAVQAGVADWDDVESIYRTAVTKSEDEPSEAAALAAVFLVGRGVVDWRQGPLAHVVERGLQVGNQEVRVTITGSLARAVDDDLVPWRDALDCFGPLFGSDSTVTLSDEFGGDEVPVTSLFVHTLLDRGAVDADQIGSLVEYLPANLTDRERQLVLPVVSKQVTDGQIGLPVVEQFLTDCFRVGSVETAEAVVGFLTGVLKNGTVDTTVVATILDRGVRGAPDDTWVAVLTLIAVEVERERFRLEPFEDLIRNGLFHESVLVAHKAVGALLHATISQTAARDRLVDLLEHVVRHPADDVVSAGYTVLQVGLMMGGFVFEDVEHLLWYGLEQAGGVAGKMVIHAIGSGLYWSGSDDVRFPDDLSARFGDQATDSTVSWVECRSILIGALESDRVPVRREAVKAIGAALVSDHVEWPAVEDDFATAVDDPSSSVANDALSIVVGLPSQDVVEWAEVAPLLERGADRADDRPVHVAITGIAKGVSVGDLPFTTWRSVLEATFDRQPDTVAKAIAGVRDGIVNGHVDLDRGRQFFHDAIRSDAATVDQTVIETVGTIVVTCSPDWAAVAPLLRHGLETGGDAAVEAISVTKAGLYKGVFEWRDVASFVRDGLDGDVDVAEAMVEALVIASSNGTADWADIVAALDYAADHPHSRVRRQAMDALGSVVADYGSEVHWLDVESVIQRCLDSSATAAPSAAAVRCCEKVVKSAGIAWSAVTSVLGPALSHPEVDVRVAAVHTTGLLVDCIDWADANVVFREALTDRESDVVEAVYYVVAHGFEAGHVDWDQASPLIEVGLGRDDDVGPEYAVFAIGSGLYHGVVDWVTAAPLLRDAVAAGGSSTRSEVVNAIGTLLRADRMQWSDVESLLRAVVETGVERSEGAPEVVEVMDVVETALVDRTIGWPTGRPLVERAIDTDHPDVRHAAVRVTTVCLEEGIVGWDDVDSTVNPAVESKSPAVRDQVLLAAITAAMVEESASYGAVRPVLESLTSGHESEIGDEILRCVTNVSASSLSSSDLTDLACDLLSILPPEHGTTLLEFTVGDEPRPIDDEDVSTLLRRALRNGAASVQSTAVRLAADRFGADDERTVDLATQMCSRGTPSSEVLAAVVDVLESIPPETRPVDALGTLLCDCIAGESADVRRRGFELAAEQFDALSPADRRALVDHALDELIERSSSPRVRAGAAAVVGAAFGSTSRPTVHSAAVARQGAAAGLEDILRDAPVMSPETKVPLVDLLTRLESPSPVSRNLVDETLR